MAAFIGPVNTVHPQDSSTTDMLYLISGIIGTDEHSYAEASIPANLWIKPED